MGEFTGSNQVTDQANSDMNRETGRTVPDTNTEEPKLYPTDIPDLHADGVVKKGMEEFPVFDVSGEEFYSNQRADRRRLRFKVGSKAGTYMQKTKNGHRPFYVRYTDAKGISYSRKIR